MCEWRVEDMAVTVAQSSAGIFHSSPFCIPELRELWLMARFAYCSDDPLLFNRQAFMLSVLSNLAGTLEAKQLPFT
jgi:hypothetical protein